MDEFKNLVLNDVRPTLPNDLSKGLLQFITSLWVRDPNSRKSFEEMLANSGQIFNDIIIEASSLGNSKLEEMWKKFGKDSVNFRTDFLMPFCQTFNILFTPEELDQGNVDLKCLQSILRVGEDGVLTYPNFYRFVKFFSPITTGSELLLKVRKLLSCEWFYGDFTNHEASNKLDQCDPKTFLVRFASEGDTYSISFKIKNKEKTGFIINHHKLPPEDIPKIFSVVNKTWKKKYKMKPPPHGIDRPYAPIFNPKEGYSHNYLLLSDSEQKRKEKEFFNMGTELKFELTPPKSVEFVN